MLSIACEGGGEDIFRVKTETGGWKYLVVGSDMRVDEEVDVHTWEHDAGDTLDWLSRMSKSKGHRGFPHRRRVNCVS